MCDRNDIYVSSKCLERCCCKGSWHLACWGTVLFPCTAAMCVRLPPSDVVTPCNCHCSVLRILNARAFCTGVAGGDTELGGPGGHDAGAASSQEVEGG